MPVSVVSQRRAGRVGDQNCVWCLRPAAGVVRRPISIARVSTTFRSAGDFDFRSRRTRANAHQPLLKLKLGSDQALQRVQAVRTAAPDAPDAPDAQLIVDANEAWRSADLQKLLPALVELCVALVEQPRPTTRHSYQLCTPYRSVRTSLVIIRPASWNLRIVTTS